MLAAPRTKTRSNSLFHVAALLPRAVASCVREFPFNLLIGMLLGRRLCPAQLVSPAGNLAKRGFASMSAARNSGYNCATISLSAGRATTWRQTELLADVPERSLAEVGGGVTRPMGARPSGEEKGETRLSASSRLEPSICWSSPAFGALSLSEHRILARLEIERSRHAGHHNGKLPTTFDDFQLCGVHRQANRRGRVHRHCSKEAVPSHSQDDWPDHW